MAEWLFVYGTLRPGSGHPMSRWLAAHTHLLGSARVPGWLCRISYYPGMMPGAGWVRGEVLALEPVDAAETLAALDAFELCHWRDDDEFRRERHPVTLDDGRVGEAWIYWYRGNTQGLERVESGDWLASPAGP
jgi:gamma-glutamylcyclotransferase (GGCT)/AIG2-like uncharacterized protein YtfP